MIALIIVIACIVYVVGVVVSAAVYAEEFEPAAVGAMALLWPAWMPFVLGALVFIGIGELGKVINAKNVARRANKEGSQ